MKLTEKQRVLVEQNMGLVGKVIRDKVHGYGAFPYEDLFQIGCEGLCKAAAHYSGEGCFSTYAYRAIWNEICDELIRSSRKAEQEVLVAPDDLGSQRKPIEDIHQATELRDAMENLKAGAKGTVKRGIQCLELSAQGYTSKELAKAFGAKPAAVRMWMSRARRFLKAQESLTALLG